MVCKNCEKKIREGTSVCPYCGASQNDMVSLEQMALSAKKGKARHSRPNKRKRVLVVIVAIVAVLALLLVGGYVGVNLWWDSNVKEPEVVTPEELDVNVELPTSGVVNIALLGLDDRYNTNDGRSDAIIILTADMDHNKVKLTSVARDSLLNVENYGWNDNSRDDDWTKITHAFAYGGAASAVKALNQNFNLNISKYAYVNFHEFAEVIDYLGGVDIEVQERELAQMNKHIRGMVKKSKLDIEELDSAGMQTLSGGQALAYARLRKTDSDVVRGNRQKAVLQAAFDKVREKPITQYPELLTKVLGICNTNMGMRECLTLLQWAVKNNPTIENFSMPDDSGSLYSWGGNTGADKWGWVYVLDLDYATARLHDFIYETATAVEEDAKKLKSPQFPVHMNQE